MKSERTLKNIQSYAAWSESTISNIQADIKNTYYQSMSWLDSFENILLILYDHNFILNPPK